MAYSEFPHAHYLEYDEHQILCLIKKLEDEYSEILDNSRVARAKADEALNAVNSYMQTIDAKINQQVSSAVEQATAGLKQQFIELNNRFNILTNNFSMLKNDTNKQLNDIRQELASFEIGIKAQILNRLNAIEETLTNKYDLLDRKVMARISQLERVIVEAMKNQDAEWSVTLDSALQKLYEDIDNIFNERFDYLTNLYEEIKNSAVYNHVEWLWNNLCQTGGFSAKEIYEYPEFNCKMWNESGITCKEWFTNGKQILGYNKERVFNPINGSVESVSKALIELIQLLDRLGIIQNGNDAKYTCKKGIEECIVQQHQT